jgi:hypothetical protein
MCQNLIYMKGVHHWLISLEAFIKCPTLKTKTEGYTEILLHTVCTTLPTETSQHTKVQPKYCGLVPPSIQQLWQRKSPVDGRTTMSSESVCQVSRSWVDVDSFHKCLLIIFMIFTASVRVILDTPSYTSPTSSSITT